MGRRDNKVKNDTNATRRHQGYHHMYRILCSYCLDSVGWLGATRKQGHESESATNRSMGDHGD